MSLRFILSVAAMGMATLGGQAQNPYLPLWEHVPDGEPRVFEDPDRPGHFRAYVVGSHDTHYDSYCGNDVRMWSAPVEDLSQWRDEGALFKYFAYGEWDTMYAPDLVEVVNRQTGKKEYWLYPHSRGWRRVGTVCRGPRPDGPFTPVNLTADGTRCVDGSLIDFDPSVFVETISDKKDKDYATGYRAYVYYGFKHSTAYELDPENMFGVRPGTEVHDYFLPASHSYGVLCDPPGLEYPALLPGQKPGDFNFFEASSIRKVGNKYVMVFSGYSGPEYGLGSTNSALRYAYGDSPLGPWRSGGVLVDSRGVVLSEDGATLVASNAAHNTHGSLQEINGQWYVFYHRPPRGYGYARQAMVAPVKIVADKKPVAKGGTVRITAYDPFAKNCEWTALAKNGNHYTGAEVTSEGFQLFGLPPYRYYSAGIACYLSNQQWLKDNYDVWSNHMDLAEITAGGIVGFKYFGFGGLQSDTKGVRAFDGTKKGDGTQLMLNLTACGNGAFRIHVMLDGPYANDVWKGREIAVLDIPADVPKESFSRYVAVPAIEGLQGKHAIYLVAEGQGNMPLLNLHGIGFVKAGDTLTPPTTPTVTITVDGRQLKLPAQPVFANKDNGFTEVNHYQVYGPLNGSSQIEVKADQPGVTMEVGRIENGRATVTCTYKGQKKIFLIN